MAVRNALSSAIGSGRNATPIVREVRLSANDLLRGLLALPDNSRVSILDSCGARDPSSRFLIAGFNPSELIEARGTHASRIRNGAKTTFPVRLNALDLLDECLAEHSHYQPPTEDLPAVGACIATFSYELGYQLERFHLDPQLRSTTEPDMVLAFFDTLVIHDYQNGKTRLVSVGGQERLDEASEALLDALGRLTEDYETTPVAAEPAVSNFTRDEYLSAVSKIQEHIAAGDIYQANLTQQFRLKLKTTPEAVFWRLRRDHPASFASFIRREEDVVISASPERFLRAVTVNGDRIVEAWPIKGTRPRGRSAVEDARLRAELLASEKDRAENIMIVDLLRNDLGRVSRYGSVEVAELCALQTHPTLFHLVSKVRGRLRDNVTAGALLRAAFPCGSVTGAPKIRAMEIINAIEAAPRGLSMGAIGYFSYDGSLDLNVAIRTMVVRNSIATFNVGGGIVADSVPSLEYDESLLKARALLHALGGEQANERLSPRSGWKHRAF